MSKTYCGMLSLLLVAACAVEAEPIEELDEAELETVSSEAASGCGWLRSGEQLRPGESVQSCNGKANLVHQTDGNVVEYQASGALWSTGTWGRSTSTLAMQTDGNLVLYSSTGQPLWYTGTHGNPGAQLAIQDDCNLVIYSSTGRVLWANYKFCSQTQEDLLPYFRNTKSPTLLGTDGSIVGYSQTGDGNTWWYRKWKGTAKKFEKYTATSNMIYLVRDTSWSWNGWDSYDPLDGFPLAKRYWPESEAIEFTSRLKPFNSSTCASSSERPVHGWYRRIKYHRGKCWDGNVGCVDSIAISSAFLDNRAQPREVHWYAKGYGWVRYEEYDAAGNRTRDIYWTNTSPDVYPVSDTCP